MVTPVTVIEARPCPVVQVKTVETDGYEAVQLAFEPVAERKLTKARARPPAEGRRRARTATSSSSAAPASSRSARPSPSRRSSPARRSRSRGSAIGKGFAGTIKRHRFHRGPKTPRLAQRPQARLDRRVGDALARLQGHEDGRPPGRQARDPGRARRSTTVDAEQNLLLVKGAVPGPKNGIVEVGRRSAVSGRAEGPAPRRRRQGLEAGHARRRRLRRRGQAASRPRDRARRAERPPRRHARRRRAAAMVSGGRAKPWRQKGTGRARAGTTRAPHCAPAAASPSRRRCAASRSRSTARRGAPRCAARSRRTPRRARSALVDASVVRRRRRRSVAEKLLADWGKELPARRRRHRGRGRR